MGRFNPLAYRPQDDSTPGLKYEGVNRKTTVVLLRDEGCCPCGCNTRPAGKNRTFAIGHDARLRGKLIRAHLTGTPVVYITSDERIETGTAMEWAADHQWVGFLMNAEEKQGAVVREKLERANADVLAAATGPQPGDRRTVKVGRWSYTGQLIAVYDVGDDQEFEVEYVTKKGDRHTARVPKASVGEVVAGA